VIPRIQSRISVFSDVIAGRRRMAGRYCGVTGRTARMGWWAKLAQHSRLADLEFSQKTNVLIWKFSKQNKMWKKVNKGSFLEQADLET
jgi:hypothetical protein